MDRSALNGPCAKPGVAAQIARLDGGVLPVVISAGGVTSTRR
jgi:hypothetical protein